MMFEGKCPNCGSDKIYRSKGYLRWDKMTGESEHLKYPPDQMILVHHYACIDCRRVDTYVMDHESVQNILEEWYPVNDKSKRTDST